MEDQKLQGYYEIWKKKFTTANLRYAAGVRNTKVAMDPYNVDLIKQRSKDKYVILYGKTKSKEHIKICKNKKPKK
jgi:hypothetical protein